MNFLRIFLTEATEATEAAPSPENIAANMDSMVDMLDMLMLIMLVGFGIYAIYSAIRLYREQMLIPNKILYPGNCPPNECLDEGAFIDFMVPRTLILGGVLLVLGIAFGLNMYLFEIDALWIDISSMVVPVAAIVVYVLMQRKAAKLFWGVDGK